MRELYGAEPARVLRQPNDLLGVEYCKALAALGSGMRPVAVPREGSAHDGAEPGGGIASAGFLRAHLNEDLSAFLPRQTVSALTAAREAGALSGGWTALERPLLYRLRTMGAEEFAALPGCADGLGDRLRRAAATAQSAQELFALAKTKRYTMSRVRRAALAALLGLREADYAQPPACARLLALGDGGGALLRRIGQTARLPLSHSLARLEALGGPCARTARLSATAHDIYALSCPAIAPQGEDYTHKFVKSGRTSHDTEL